MAKHTKLSSGSSDSCDDEESPTICTQEIKRQQRKQTPARGREMTTAALSDSSHDEFFTARQNSYPSTSVCQLLIICVP